MSASRHKARKRKQLEIMHQLIDQCVRNSSDLILRRHCEEQAAALTGGGAAAGNPSCFPLRRSSLGRPQRIIDPPLPPPAALLHRCWSSGRAASRAPAAPLRPACRHPLSPTAPPTQPSTTITNTTCTGPRSQTPPPRPWPSPTPLTFTRSPGLSMRVGVSRKTNAGLPNLFFFGMKN